MRESKRGPKTPRGKRAVSRNAVKHAIFARDPVVIAGYETVEEWEEHHAGFVESLQPVGKYEEELAYDVAFGLWRLRRCRIQEAAQLSKQLDETAAELIDEVNEDEDDDDEDEDQDEDGGETGPGHERPAKRRPRRRVHPARLRAQQHLGVIPDSWSMDRILRYETHVRRALLQTIHELEAHQARRLGGQPPLARVDFTAGPSLRRPTTRGSSTFEQLSQDLDRQRDLARRRRARRPEPPGESATMPPS